MSDETFRGIVIAVITLLGGSGIGGTIVAYVLRNRRLEKAQTDKEVIEAVKSRYDAILDDTGEVQDRLARLAKESVEREMATVHAMEDRHKRDIGRLEKRIEELETSQLATEKENIELRRQVKEVVAENVVLRQQVEELVMRERKSTLIRQINYYAMLISKVSPPLDPAGLNKISLADLERKANEFKEQARDQSNFQDYSSHL